MANSEGAGLVVSIDVNPLPGPREWIEEIIRFFVEKWQKSASDSLQESIELLQKTPWPDFNGEGFRYLFGNAITIAYLTSVLLIALLSIVTIVSRNGQTTTRLVGAGKDFVLIMVAGIAFPLGIATLTYTSDALSRIPVTIGRFASDNDNLSSSLTLPNLSDIGDSLLQLFIIRLFSLAMNYQVQVIYASLYIFSFLSILILPFRNGGKWSERAFRWNISLIFTCLAAKPLMLLWVALGSIILAGIPGDNSAQTFAIILMVTFLSSISFIVLFFMFNHKLVQVFGENRSEVQGRVDINKLPPQSTVEKEVRNSRANTLTPVSEHRLSEVQTVKPSPEGLTQMAAVELKKQGTSSAVDKAIIVGSTAAGHPHAGPVIVAGKNVVQEYRATRATVAQQSAQRPPDTRGGEQQ